MKNIRIYAVLTLAVFVAGAITWSVINRAYEEPLALEQTSTTSSSVEEVQVDVYIDPEPGPSVGSPGANSVERMTLNFVYLDDEGSAVMQVTDSTGQIQEIMVRNIKSFDAYPLVPGSVYDVYLNESNLVHNIVLLANSPLGS